MTSMNSVLENRPLNPRARIGPPDVYPQDPKQKEDELTTANVKQGFNNQIPYVGENVEHGSAQHFSIDANKLNKSFNDIIQQKQVKVTFNDTVKKKPALTKDNFWLVPVAKQKTHLQWIKDLKAGVKSLNYLGRKLPIFSKKEEVFQTLAENQISIFRATWYIKMTAQYGVLQAETKNKKNRITVDHNPDWTTSICRFMRDQLSRLLDDQTLNNSLVTVIPPGMSIEDSEKQFEYISKLANHMYSEGMLDRHDFLNWIVETMEKIRLHGTRALSYMMPMVMKHIQDIIKNQLLSRRLVFVATRLLSWLLNEATWGNPAPKSSAIESPSPISVGPPSVSGQPTPKQHSAPPTPSQVTKPLSPHKLGQTSSVTSVKPRALPANFPPSLEDVAYGLICIVQCVTLECPGALIWYRYRPDDPHTPGSPLDYLPVRPSLLPLPSDKESSSTSNDNLTRARLREVEDDIVQRSFAAEMRWSSDKCQESVTGQTITRVLAALEILDKQQNFDRTDSIDTTYREIFVDNNNKDGNDQGSQASEEAVIWLLCEWAVSAQRLGEHRASVVAKLLDKRQMLLEQEQAAMAVERAKALNSSNPTTSSSNPGSVGTILSSPPPQLLVEGVEPPQMDTSLPQHSLSIPGVMNNNPNMFQTLLFNFLDTQAPILDNPLDKNELRSFKNLIMLFSELIQHDVFSHDDYVNTLISTGDITPGQISPLPIYSPNSGHYASMTGTLGYSNHSVGVTSVPSVGPTSVGGPVSNKPMDIGLKPDVDDELPSSVQSIDRNPDMVMLFSPNLLNSDYPLSPSGRSMNESRHFTDVIKKIPDNPKDKSGNMGHGTPIKRPNGPIWGYKQPRHVQYLMHLPIPFEDDDCVHESNQRMMVLYGAGRQRNEVKKEVKKITKYICKLVLKHPSHSPKENNFCPSSVKSASGGSSKKSRIRMNDSSSHPPSQDMLLKRFRCLSYFDQHYVTAQALKTILSSLNDYIESVEGSFNLPLLGSIILVLNLMEEGLNISGIVQLSVQISTLLTSLETKISQKNPELAGCYTKDLALNIVAILRHYQSYLTLDADLMRQAFDAMYAFIIQSNITSPDHCTSADRCILILLYDLFAPPRSKYLLESQVLKFSSFASAIKQNLCQSKIPAKSNCRYENSFVRDFIDNPNLRHPLLTAQEKCHMLRDATYKYSFVCSAIISVCSGHHTPESLSSIATLCAEMNAQCDDLSSEWLGVLKALSCSSSATANFTDVLLYVDPANEAIRDPLALFTAILIARNCLSMENFIKHVAIPPLLAACRPGLDDPEVMNGARLTCHILLQLFKTPTPPDMSKAERPSFYIPEAADRHLLAASQRNIVVGAVLAVLKAIVKLGDASFNGRQSSSPSNNDTGVTSFLAPLGHDEMDDGFGLPGQARPQMNSDDSRRNQSLSEFAKNAVRVICSQQWVRERCLKKIEWDFLMDQEVTQTQRQNLIQLICCPEEDLQVDMPQDQRSYVLQVLNRMSRWTLRQTLLELQIMLREAAQDRRLSENIAKAVIEVFKNQNMDATKDQKSLITGVELDKSNVWLMPPLISELSSQVKAKVLHEASAILETSQHWSRSKSDRDRNLGKNPASLLSQQPFLALILTCLKGQDEQRETLLESLQSQILMFHSEWQSSRQQQHRDSNMSQSAVQEALQLRLSLMGGMFDTVQSSSPWTSSVVVLLTQLVSSGMVDIEVNAKLFNTVFDMIAVLLHGTLGGDSPSSGEGRKRDYPLIVRKIRKEISDGKSTSLKILRRLLPIPRKEVYVITCEQTSSGTERQIASKQKIGNWDIIEGLKTSAPLCLSWYGASKTERKELPYETQQRLMLFHSHEDWQQPRSDYLKPPELPDEEEEKPPTPKPSGKRRATTSSSKQKSPSAGGGSQYGSHKESLSLPNKKIKHEKQKRKPKKTPDLSGTYSSRGMVSNIYGAGVTHGSMGMGPMGPHTSQPIRPTLPSYGNNTHQPYNVYQPQGSHHTNITSNHSYGINHPAATNKAHSRQQVKRGLADYLTRKQQQYQTQLNPNYEMSTHMHSQQPMDNSSRNAIRSFMLQKAVTRGGMVQNDMGQMPYRTGPRPMAPPFTPMRSMNNASQGQISGYTNYSQQGGGNMNQMHVLRNSNYNYQGNMTNQQQGYHQTVPSQSYVNQQNSNMGTGYPVGGMQMQGSGMNQPSGYGMSSGMAVQNQSSMMAGQQPPQYSMMGQQPRAMTRMNPQHHMNAGGRGQGSMMQMQGMAGGQNTMNAPMGRSMQMINQGMGSQYAPQQHETAQLVKNLRRNMPPNQ